MTSPLHNPSTSSKLAVPLPESIQLKGQNAAILTNLPMLFVQLTVTGSLMMLFANDVLHFSTKRISAMLALISVVNMSLPIIFLPILSRFRKINIMTAGFCVGLLVVIALVALPAQLLTIKVYFCLLLLFTISQRLGQGLVWQPLLRDITTDENRGSFFAKMRFVFNMVSTIAAGIIPFVIGRSVTESQYKWFLLAAGIGLIIQIVCCRKIPERRHEPPPTTDRDRGFGKLIQTIRSSALLRRPLLISILFSFTSLPIYILYLKKMLNIPSNLVQIYTFLTILGGTLSLLLWGKISDSIGYRPTLLGLLLLGLPLPLLQLLLAPLPAESFGWGTVTLAQLVTLTALAVFGLVSGIFTAGSGIAITSIQHSHTRGKKSIEEMNIYAIVTALAMATITYLSGILLDDIAIPYGSTAFMNGHLHFDWIKGYMILIGLPLSISMIWQVSKLANTKPYRGVGVFFNTLNLGTLKVFTAGRHIYHQCEERRAGAAYNLGKSSSPLSVDNLLKLLSDPDYDVKTEAIRALGHSTSPVAAAKLLEILTTPQRHLLADQCAWALGELRYQPAVPALLEFLNASHDNHIRSIAARALGKIGNQQAAGPLATLLTSSQSETVTAAATRALLRLNWSDYADQIFTTFYQLKKREERIEVSAALCATIGIDSRWLLDSQDDNSIVEILINYVEKQPAKWRAAKDKAIRLLINCDVPSVRREFIQQTQNSARTGTFDTEQDRAIQSMQKAISCVDHWQPIYVLASAWLLFSTPTNKLAS